MLNITVIDKGIAKFLKFVIFAQFLAWTFKKLLEVILDSHFFHIIILFPPKGSPCLH